MQRSGVDERQKPRAGTTIGDTILEEVGSTVAHQPAESLLTSTMFGMQPGACWSRFNSDGVAVFCIHDCRRIHWLLCDYIVYCE